MMSSSGTPNEACGLRRIFEFIVRADATTSAAVVSTSCDAIENRLLSLLAYSRLTSLPRW